MTDIFWISLGAVAGANLRYIDSAAAVGRVLPLLKAMAGQRLIVRQHVELE